MNLRKFFILGVTHLLAIGVGFAAGIYALPILIAPDAPKEAVVLQAAQESLWVGEFSRDRMDSDRFHWGEGIVSLSKETISLAGVLAPGPDYRIYLSPVFVETEADFNRLKPKMVEVGEVKTFENFVVSINGDVDPADYSAVIIWCETFGQFITSAQYSPKRH